MPKDFFITHWVKITKNQVVGDGKTKSRFPEALPIDDFLKAGYATLPKKYPKFHKMDALSKLGFLAVEWLCDHQKIHEDTALIFQNRAGSLHTDLKHQAKIDAAEMVSPATFVYTLPNILLGELSIRHQLKTPQAFFVADKYDIPFMTQYVKILLHKKRAAQAISGWIDLDNHGYNVFLTLISEEGSLPFNEENVQQLYLEEYE